ncbi:hypothetical protein [Microbacterium sp. 22242]|uniref:hypothetical protein n=1 Tax=Microbacterium sp. 22242 TaxID=3453896 RepID=UPI003F85390F
MDVRTAHPLTAMGAPFDVNPEYRVRAWTVPIEPGSAWMVDEWDLVGASGVEEVLTWAGDIEADSVEVFVQVMDSRRDVHGEIDERRRFIRLSGHPADDGGESVTVRFVKNE